MRNKTSLFSKSNLIAVIWLVMVSLATFSLVNQWRSPNGAPIETDVLKLLPINQQNPVTEVAFSRIADAMSQTLIFVVSGDNIATAQDASQLLANKLKQSGNFAQVTDKITPEQQSAWAKFYFDHRFQFLTPEQHHRLSVDPSQQTQYVIQSIYNPFSGVTGKELEQDPFLLFRDYLSELTRQSGAFTLQEGYLTLEKDGQTHILLTAKLNASPYSIHAQQVVPQIKQWTEQLTQDHGVVINATGVLFYADFGTQSAKQEISTIGLVSLLGVVLLIAVVFRSLMPLHLALLSIAIGLLMALSVTLFVFGRVHLFSLVIGASLIGVSIDYAFHYLTDRLAAGNQWDSRKGLQHILVAISLGLVTSLIGYLGLLIAPFPGLQQLALFSSVGLLGAYLTVVAWYPILAQKPSPDRQLPGLTMWQWWLTQWQSKGFAIGFPLTLCLLGGLALTQVNYDDDIRQLQAMPAALKQQESTITELTGLQSSQQMLVVTAQNDQQLLNSLAKLKPQFEQWQQQGVLKGHQSLSQYISETQVQEDNYRLVQRLYQEQSDHLQQTLGLTSPPRFSGKLEPITLPAFLESAPGEPIAFLYLGEINGQVASAILLQQLSQPAIIAEFAKQSPQLHYLNKSQELSELFEDYRTKVMELLAIAMLIIYLVLSIRFGFKHAIKMVIPCLIACVGSLAVSALVGSSLNLFSLLALVLVIGIGIDYTLFFAEQNGSHSTLLAVSLSATTTLLSFGLLALSDTHAIHSFGLTVLSGILITWLLAPMAIATRKTPC